MGGEGGLGKYGLTHGHKEFLYELGRIDVCLCKSVVIPSRGSCLSLKPFCQGPVLAADIPTGFIPEWSSSHRTRLKPHGWESRSCKA